MAYYLMQKKKGNYYSIDISNLEQFKRKSKFKNDCYTLEELDAFTSKFEDEVELKRCLYDNNLITIEDITNDLSIRMKYKEELKKVAYGFIYKKDKEFVNPNKDRLRATVLSLQDDIVFLKKLVSHYRGSYSNALTIAEIGQYLITNGNCDVNIYLSLNYFFANEVFKENKGTVSIKYKSLHDLALFTIDYITKKEAEKHGLSPSYEYFLTCKRLFELQKELIIEEKKNKNKEKKKVLKKGQIEGQISFFDEML